MNRLKRIWCRKVTLYHECSYCTPGAIWSGEYYEVATEYAVPFWVNQNDEDEEDYIERNEGNDRIYW